MRCPARNRTFCQRQRETPEEHAVQRRSWNRITVGGLLLAVGVVQGGEIVMLPALGGAWSFAYDINEGGLIVGEADLADGITTHAVVWDGGVPTDLGAISGNSFARAINDQDQIIGASETGGLLTAMLWQGGAWTDLGADMGAAGSSVAWDINTTGLVVGQASFNGGFSTGFVWSGTGTGQEAGTVGGYNGGANKGVNAGGVSVGHGFFFGDPDMAMMGVPDSRGGYDEFEIGPSGYNFSIAAAINDGGTIVGLDNNGNGPWQAAIFTLDVDNPVISLGTLPELENSEAYDINEAGVIVGSAWDNDFLLQPRAWVYFDGAMHDLNDFLDPDQAEWEVLQSAEGINERGDIVGYGVTTAGVIRGYVFTGVVPLPCRADINGDGVTDTQDFLSFLNLWVTQDDGADWNRDGGVDTQDFLAFLNEWVSCR
jgi:probable HAF family extracellular repeat protein